jgi:hypothetical protein
MAFEGVGAGPHLLLRSGSGRRKDARLAQQQGAERAEGARLANLQRANFNQRKIVENIDSLEYLFPRRPPDHVDGRHHDLLECKIRGIYPASRRSG